MRELIERLEVVYGRAEFVPRFGPMDELVSCILSQHTADVNSFPTFAKLRETFPEWQEVVDAGPQRLAEVIRTAGLANQKAKSIIGCLERIHADQGSYSLEVLRGMPMLEARKWLLGLPGVGPKTASIVLCFAFGMGAIPVDTHVHRVSRRLGLISETTNENKAHDVLLQAVPEDLAFRFHVALIQHGRQTCKAPIPLCERCSVQSLCPWFRSVGPEKARAAIAAKQKGKLKKA